MKITRKEVPVALLKAYPDYKGRKFSVHVADQYYPSNYWDGGSRNYFKVMFISTGEFVNLTLRLESPFDPAAHQPIPILDDWCVVEHSIFQGRDMGLRFYVNHNNTLFNEVSV